MPIMTCYCVVPLSALFRRQSERERTLAITAADCNLAEPLLHCRDGACLWCTCLFLDFETNQAVFSV